MSAFAQPAGGAFLVFKDGPTTGRSRRLFGAWSSGQQRGRLLRARRLGRLHPNSVLEWLVERVADERHHPAVERVGAREALDQREVALE